VGTSCLSPPFTAFLSVTAFCRHRLLSHRLLSSPPFVLSPPFVRLAEVTALMGAVENQRTVYHRSHQCLGNPFGIFHTPAARRLLKDIYKKQTGRGVPELIASQRVSAQGCSPSCHRLCLSRLPLPEPIRGYFVWSRIIRRAYPVAHIPIAAFQVSHYPSLVIPTNGRDLQFSPLQPFFVVGGYAPSNLGVVAHHLSRISRISMTFKFPRGQ